MLDVLPVGTPVSWLTMGGDGREGSVMRVHKWSESEGIDYLVRNDRTGVDHILGEWDLTVQKAFPPCTSVSVDGFPCDVTGRHDIHEGLMVCGAIAKWVTA